MTLFDPNFSILVFCSPFHRVLAQGSLQWFRIPQQEYQRKARKLDYVPLIFASLHTLSVRVRSDLKVLLMTHKEVNRPAYSHLSNQSSNPSLCITLSQYWSPVWVKKKSADYTDYLPSCPAPLEHPPRWHQTFCLQWTVLTPSSLWKWTNAHSLISSQLSQ